MDPKPCPTGKVIYLSADELARRITRNGDTAPHGQLRPYRCPICHEIHVSTVTASSKRHQRARRRISAA
jgi:hypothetical protein